MLVKGAVLSVIWNIVSYTDRLNLEGKVIPRATFGRKGLRSRNSLLAKVYAATEVGVVDKSILEDKVRETDISWTPNFFGFQAPEGKKMVAERFLDTDVALSDGEKALIRECLEEREEVPALSDEDIDSFKELCGFGIDE